MSLINDALKKARKAQPAGTTANAPDLLPVEAPAGGRGGSIFTLPFIITVVLVLAAVMIWAWYRAGQVIVVRGNAGKEPTSAVQPASEAKPKVAATISTTTVKTETPASATTMTSTPAMVTSADAGSTNVLMAAATEAPKPMGPVYKLEGIFYSAKKPSAVINGDLVYVGSRVKAGRVVAIDEESATVVTEAGETNLLVLTR